MSTNPTISVILTVLFAVTLLGYVGFALRPGTAAVSRVSDVLHVLMSAAMMVMPWPLGMRVAPAQLQVVVFALGVVFYLVLLIGGDRLGGHRHGGPGGSSRVVLGYHVVMMAAMVVMAVMMLPTAGGSDMTMPGMDMSAGGSMPAGEWAGWGTVSWGLAALFAVASAWMLLRLIGFMRARRHPLAVADGVLLLVMSAGMALAFVPAG